MINQEPVERVLHSAILVVLKYVDCEIPLIDEDTIIGDEYDEDMIELDDNHNNIDPSTYIKDGKRYRKELHVLCAQNEVYNCLKNNPLHDYLHDLNFHQMDIILLNYNLQQLNSFMYLVYYLQNFLYDQVCF